MGASVACLAEVWSLAAVACDRFRAVYYPLERGKRLTKLQVIKRGFRNSNINCMFDFLYQLVMPINIKICLR